MIKILTVKLLNFVVLSKNLRQDQGHREWRTGGGRGL